MHARAATHRQSALHQGCTHLQVRAILPIRHVPSEVQGTAASVRVVTCMHASLVMHVARGVLVSAELFFWMCPAAWQGVSIGVLGCVHVDLQ